MVSEFLRDALSSFAGNPSSIHGPGRAARTRLDRARARIAQVLGCEPREVVFTSSGSESDAIAIVGAFRARSEPTRRRVVTSAVEHPAVLGAVAELEREGAAVFRVAPDRSGRVSEAEVLEALTPDTLLCSLMWANNETGVLQPVSAIARECRRRGVLFHTDAVQAAGKVPVTLREVDADLLTLSAHKFGGPPGSGVLIVRKGVDVAGLVPGHQEGGRRGGTQNVIYAEATALALELSQSDVQPRAAALEQVRDHFEQQLRARIPSARINGGESSRVANTSNVQFAGVDGESLLIALDLSGIHASSGAACASGTLRPSHVLTAMGLSASEAKSSLRFSFGAEFDRAAAGALVEVLARTLREQSALSG